MVRDATRKCVGYKFLRYGVKMKPEWLNLVNKRGELERYSSQIANGN